MKQRFGLSSALMIGLLAACSEAPPLAPAVVEAPPPDDAARAQAAMQDLGGSLRSALQAVMMRDGPLGAVDFCHDEAPKIAQAVSEKHGLQVGRTALRYRSPANAPNEWQLPVLQDFQARFESGQPVAELTSMQREGLPEGVTLRAMRGIPLEPQCQLCHGVEIAPTLAEAIAQRYPGDQATGFSAGDLRGAVWAEVLSQRAVNSTGAASPDARGAEMTPQPAVNSTGGASLDPRGAEVNRTDDITPASGRIESPSGLTQDNQKEPTS